MPEDVLEKLVDGSLRTIDETLGSYEPRFGPQEIGRVRSISEGVVWAKGLREIRSQEMLLIGGDVPGMALEILPDRVGIVLLDEEEKISSGMEVVPAGRVLDVPVGDGLIGRIVNPIGKPLDGKGIVQEEDRWPIQREAPDIFSRAPVKVPLQTGLKVIDALLPIGRGQRELILGDRQTGKTAIATDSIINQRDKDVLCIYCAIGQRSSSVAKVVNDLKEHGCLEYTTVVVAEGDEVAGLQFSAPYAATTIGEYFMTKGRDVLIVYDDLTRHANAYRQLSLLLRRPPGREAYPGDIFYIHSRMLERATHLKEEKGGGSLTALPIIETEAQNISAYIPTNLISITDGQIYLSPELFQKGIMPAIEVGLSVSRVGGKTQFPSYRMVAGDLRLSYTQFQELESFSRFGTRLDEKTKEKLEHGRRVREILKQDQASTMSAVQQIIVLLAVTEGYLDQVPLDKIAEAEGEILRLIGDKWPELDKNIENIEKNDPIWDEVKEEVGKALEQFKHP